MIKKLRRVSTKVLLFISLSLFSYSVPTFANAWKASILPASLNPDSTVRLVGGEVQDVVLALQADKDVTSRANTHNITLEWDLPSGISIVGNGGCFTFSDPQTQQMPYDRTIVKFQVQVSNNYILGAPGTRLGSEWKNHSIFVSVPKSIPVGQNFLRLKLTDGDYSQTFSWPIQIDTLTPPAERPKRTSLGFWDYNYSNVTSTTAANGVAKLFRDSGITFTEDARNDAYRKALQAQGIITGGNTWEGAFFDKNDANYNAAGKAISSFSDPQAIIALPKDAAIPGVAQMAANAKAGDGVATFDYEPNGLSGFSPAATQAFKQQYNVSDTDFETFQKYVAANGFKTAQATDPVIAKIWRQWTQFRSDQVANYIRRISEAFKAQLPNGRIAITPSFPYGKNSVRTLAMGCDNAAMAQYVDMVLPQIYCGYGGAAAKLAMQMTTGWREEIQQQKAKTQLWPLLLVRYAGAIISNSPQRLRQQIIGCLANGANGITFYYPGMMDAPYWEMLARTTEDIAKYEDFYQDGTRVDDKFPVSNMPQGSIQITMYPGYQETVQNPDWSFTAHQLGNKILLTMINLQDANALVFTVNTGNAKVLSTQNTKETSNHQWSVEPGQIGFVVLDL